MPALLPLLAATLLLTPQPLLMSQPPTDEALKKSLEATKLNFVVSPSGKSFTVLFDHVNNRKQTVYATVAQESLASYKTHFIYTTVWVGTAPPSEEIMKKTFLLSKKIGHFYLLKDQKGTWAIRFGAHFDASEPAEKATVALKDIIFFVDNVGEEVDLLLNGPSKDNR
jgi:hypothetical protein